MSIELVMPSNHLILCHPLFLCFQSSPTWGSFSWVSLSNQVAKTWELSFINLPINENSRLISFRIDWFDLLALKGTLKSLLKYHNLKVSILWNSAFLMVQLSKQHMITGKTIALTIWTFVDKVMSLLFNMLSKSVIVFLPRSKHPLVSWLQSPSAVILEPKKIKSVTASTFSPSICHKVIGLNAVILGFFKCWVSSEFFSLSFFTLIKRSFSILTFCHYSDIICISEALIFLPAILITLCHSSTWYFTWCTL